MRIAFITEAFPKRSETFILGKVVMLKRLGHEVTVFTQFRRTEPMHPDFLRELDLRREVVRLPAWDRVRPKDVARGLAGAGPHPLRMAVVARAALAGPAPRGLTLVKSLPFARGRYDLIHAFYAHMGLRYLDTARTLKLPLVVSLFGTDTSIHVPENPAAFQPLFAAAARLVAVVDYLKGVAVAHGCDPAKVTVIPTEVDTGFFRPVARVRTGPAVILTVGRLHWTKGYLYALAAMAALKAAGVNFRYRIVGEGEDRPALSLCIRDLLLGDRVELVGPRDREGVRAELEAADVFLLPSVIEGIGGVLLEAQATALPVVATRVGGLPEAVREGESGLLVPSRDPAALAAALKRLLERPAERAAMGERGRAFTVEHFDAAALMRRLVAVYEETVSEHGRR
jgi:colanic acid/amylovoran biosynthesis glycosyltransferase